MRTKGFSIGIIFLVLMVCTTCTKDEVLLTPDGESSVLKSVMATIEVQASGDISGITDHFNINEALQNAGPGDVIKLGEGVFYLHKSIIKWDFNGTLKGSGMDKTVIQTAPGIAFDVSECPLLEWSWITVEGHALLFFPHNPNTEERTVIVSDLTIISNEPTTVWRGNITGPGEAYERNNLQAINVYYKNLNGMPYYWGDVLLSDKIDLNVHFKNLTIIGDEDPGTYIGSRFSLHSGVAACGASEGNFEATNIYVTNAAEGIFPVFFCGENSMVSIKNCKVENSFRGIYSWVNTGWIIKDNEFKNCYSNGLNLWTYNDIYDLPNRNSIIKDNLFILPDTRWNGIYGDRMQNVEVFDNTFIGSSYSGILARYGSNWEIIDNDLCGLIVSHPAGFTIRLDRNNIYSVVKDNANQIVGGSSANDPSNYIGEGVECK
jgi:hypothetical protein